MDTTAKYGLPYAEAFDALGSVDDTMQALAERLDLLLGETGVRTITPTVANTTVSERVNYSRDYTALVDIPRVMLTNDASISSNAVVHFWTTAEDATGFTLNCRASVTGDRIVKWAVRPR